ncbi:hypothetical protein A1O3_09026 [Capronia epimyces CBS 606.96]|uniref:Histidine kinase n=1 Tax=Capronia epimyces CBS 606.96 TaxID=1182542 RepID=W9XBN2_9EURO|nr:uncharacterized protein A1O3_09026 [Capronia epimyces CBS 606.96]EXJ77867.1 hypothetical protein A1O3_09026 [Capronia epimyces CBS 606.96]
MVAEDVQASSASPSSDDRAADARYNAGDALSDPLHSDLSRVSVATDIALAALSTLPTPLLVLSSRKTVLLANSAVGRLLGAGQDDTDRTATDVLKGQALSQIGLDLVSDGQSIWVDWDKFLDNLADGLQSVRQSGKTASTSSTDFARGLSPLQQNRTQKCPDTAVDVAISSRSSHPQHRSQTQRRNKPQGGRIRATCRMIISVWRLDGQHFFTLTFTSLPPPSSHKKHSQAPAAHRNPSSNSTMSSRSSQSHTPGTSNANSQGTWPAENATGAMFLPTSAPGSCTPSSTVADFDKVIKMKNAMLSAIDIPLVAMWRDESVVYPNLAARRLLAVDADPTSEDCYDFMSRFRPWLPDFSRELKENENPISALCRTQKAFTAWQIGLVNELTGKQTTFEVSGHPLFDQRSGEFLAAMIAFKDVTSYTNRIALQVAEKEEHFRLMCDMMPQLCWTTTPEGYHEYFSKRWYDYTGLTPAESLGLGWKLPFHEEDMPEALRRWTHSLATGEEYKAQYRCKRYDGEWRWMLGRALPLRDNKTGRILKWFGSCTDIQDIVDAKLAGQRDRKHLMDLLKHSQMTLWIIDRQEKVTFFEGTFLAEDPLKEHAVGSSIYDLLANYLSPECIDGFRAAVKRTLDGTSDLEVCENEVDSRWLRSKMVPLKDKRKSNGVEDEHYISGVIGIGTEVTQIRQKEQENIQLLANERAAKEASKMKSNFLANMSHEIRTPIAGVLGMSDLLMDTALNEEQSEFAQNIQSSANSLLTVINDILDFSKIESGRLDIEEVQFSLNIVLQDVVKMLSFAAKRKDLDFGSDIRLGTSQDLVLLGDPGRIRQILTNLLTNSIKFTSDGYVRLSACIINEADDTTTVEFCIEDSGIGIEEEVKKRLFRPFSQADSSTARRFGGTGLGLTICKNLVDLMHGTIRLESKLDTGTQATFSIPFKKREYRGNSSPTLLDMGMVPERLRAELSISLSTSSKEENRKSQNLATHIRSPNVPITAAQRSSAIPPESGTEAPASDLPREQFHILVVEDNPVNQQIAVKFIKALGFSVNAVWNGKEALEYLLKATSPDLTPEHSKVYPIPSLILMDVQMPVLDGYRATHMLRYHAPFTNITTIARIPIVAMTASAIHGDREKCEKAGMDDYMAKPVKRPLLEQTIMKWIFQGRRPPEANADRSQSPFTRACTDQSSSCTEHDVVLTGIFPGINVDQDKRDLDAPTYAEGIASAAGAGIARRSSKSRKIREMEIPGAETEANRASRRLHAEDQARDLRDAKLLSATRDDRAQSHITSGDSYSLDTSTPKGSSGYPEEVQEDANRFAMALTEKNISLLNHGQDSDFLVTRTSSSSVCSDRVDVPDIPGPPPNVSGDLAGIDADAQALVQALLDQAHHHDKPHVDGLLPRKGRRDVGGLMQGMRHNSDWSTSTTKPANRDGDASRSPSLF